MTTANEDPRPAISRDDVEKALWELTGWQGDQAVIDGILVVIDAWHACAVESLVQSSAAFRNGYYHALVTMATEIMETRGRMRLVPPEAEPVLRAGEVDALAEAILRKLPQVTQLAADPALQKSLAQVRRGEVAELREALDDPLASGLIHGKPAGGEPLLTSLPKMLADDLIATHWLRGEARCTSCGEREQRNVWKPAADFHKDSKGKNGLKSRCRECESERKSR